MDVKETGLLLVIFVVVFAAVFAAVGWYNSQNTQLFGFKVTTGGQPPLQAIKTVLEKNRTLVLREDLTENASRVNTAVGTASAELVFAAHSVGIDLHNYGAISGIPMNRTCNVNNSFCGAPDITIAVDASCNCIKVLDNHTMLVTGDAEFLISHAADLRKIILAARAYGEER